MTWDELKTQKMLDWMEAWLIENPLTNKLSKKLKLQIAHDAWLEMRRLEERAKRAAAKELRRSDRKSKADATQG